MADNQERINAMASQLGEPEKISIFLGPVKVYPGKNLADQALERIENALRSPENEKGTIRVLEAKELIYRSSQGEVDTDIKGIASSLQGRQEPSINTQDNKVGSPRSEIEVRDLEKVPDGVKLQKETNSRVESESLESRFAKFDRLVAESPAAAENVTLNVRVNQPDLVETRQHPRLENLEVEPVMSSARSPEARQSQPKLTIPLNPSPQQLDQKMPEIINSAGTTNHASTETALAAAHARIDSLQTQLDESKKSIQDLSKFVQEPSLKHWAQTKAQEIGKTSQFIAGQAKNKMMQWMQIKTDQMKEAVHQKVNEAKTVAQGKISDVTTLSQDKVSEIKTVAQGKLNHVKTSVQDKVTEVKSAAELKAIEVKEAARSQVNQFLAPVNTEKVEQSAKRLIQTYGDGRRYTKAATHSYAMNEKGDISIARQSDKAVVFQQGGVTKAATSDDILKMKALPSQLGQIMAVQRQSTQKQELEVG